MTASSVLSSLSILLISSRTRYYSCFLNKWVMSPDLLHSLHFLRIGCSFWAFTWGQSILLLEFILLRELVTLFWLVRPALSFFWGLACFLASLSFGATPLAFAPALWSLGSGASSWVLACSSFLWRDSPFPLRVHLSATLLFSICDPLRLLASDLILRAASFCGGGREIVDVR